MAQSKFKPQLLFRIVIDEKHAHRDRPLTQIIQTDTMHWEQLLEVDDEGILRRTGRMGWMVRGSSISVPRYVLNTILLVALKSALVESSLEEHADAPEQVSASWMATATWREEWMRLWLLGTQQGQPTRSGIPHLTMLLRLRQEFQRGDPVGFSAGRPRNPFCPRRCSSSHHVLLILIVPHRTISDRRRSRIVTPPHHMGSVSCAAAL